MPVADIKLLIVNADDFGRNQAATDLTIECFEWGQISSTTAMMHMGDTGRAAERALESGLPTGLHLNFTEPFTAEDVPTPIRERQLLSCRALGSQLRLRSWTYDPRIRNLIESAIEDQLEQFETQFGHLPTHVDGHNHIQVCPNVVRAKALAGLKLRNALWSWPSMRSAMGAARTLRRLVTARNFITTNYFLDIAELSRGSATELRRRLELSRRTSVEVMAHPAFDDELKALREPAWLDALASLPLGSYRDLS